MDEIKTFKSKNIAEILLGDNYSGFKGRTNKELQEYIKQLDVKTEEKDNENYEHNKS